MFAVALLIFVLWAFLSAMTLVGVRVVSHFIDEARWPRDDVQ